MGHLCAAKQIRHCRLAKQNNTEKKVTRLEVTVTQGEVGEVTDNIIFPSILTTAGAHSLPNMAPPGGMEEKLQQWIDEENEGAKGAGKSSSSRVRSQ